MVATDVTPVFDELLVRAERKPTKKHAFDVAKTSLFLKEAYRINAGISALAKQLHSVRRAYLSSAPSRRLHANRHKTNDADSAAGEPDLFLTDAQREEIDVNAKHRLRELHGFIEALVEAKKTYQAAQKKLLQTRFSFGSGRSEASRALDEMARHHEGVVYFLRQRLEACGHLQSTMSQARLARIKSASSAMAETAALVARYAVSVPARTTTTYATDATDTANATDAARQALRDEEGQQQQQQQQDYSAPDETELTDEQLQVFEKDNRSMVTFHETQMAKVHDAEKTVMEIAEMQTMLAGSLEVQAAQIEQIREDSHTAAANVAAGNDELKKALKRPSMARNTFLVSCGLCAFVIVWDFFV